jgi:hypothetical protein
MGDRVVVGLTSFTVLPTGNPVNQPAAIRQLPND